MAAMHDIISIMRSIIILDRPTLAGLHQQIWLFSKVFTLSARADTLSLGFHRAVWIKVV